MRNFFIYIFILFAFLFSQEEIGTGLYEDELIDFLQNHYTAESIYNYNDARDILYSQIDLQAGNMLYCVYSNFSIQLDLSQDPSTDAYNKGINCEHIWPQSLGANTGNPKSDMHHLRPCKDNVNSARSNHPYAEINDFLTTTWYWMDMQTSNIPQNNINEYSEKYDDPSWVNSRFEPHENIKGDIARAIFYFYTIYNNVADHDFFNIQKDILYEWHNNDPVNQQEINRTWDIASYQDNIPNPFIIDETLIYRSYFYDGQPDDETIGDVTQDGLVNIVDVVLIVNHIIDTQTLTDNQIEFADIDNNGTINIIDVVALIGIIIGE